MVRVEQLTDGPTLVLDVGGTAPVVAVYLWLRVGSADELSHQSGVAHFLEHMLFKGAGSHGVGEAVTKVEALGGEINAWTSFESTVLHATVPAGRDASVLKLLGEMAFEPHIDAAEFERERKVVLEEIREAQDSPGQVLADYQRGKAWGSHPYARPILGTVESVSALSPKSMKAFHQKFYRPSNSILVVTGAVDEDAIRGVVERSFIDTEPRPIRRDSSVDIQPAFPGSFALDGGFEDITVECAFRIPDLTHNDIAALDMLASILGGSRNAILSRVLRHERDLIVSSWAVLENERDGGLFVVGLVPRKGKVIPAVEAMAQVLAGLCGRHIQPAAIRRARAGILSDRLRDGETVDGRAGRLAWYQAHFEDLSASDRYEAAIRRCGPADLQRVATQYLDLDQVVLGMVAPQSDLDQKGLDAAWRRGVQQAPPSTVPQRTSTERTRVFLDNGLMLRCEPDPKAELVGISVMALGGTLAERARMPGLGQAWSALLSRGAGDLGTLELAAEVEERAGAIQPWSGRNTQGIQLSFPVDELEPALEILGMMLLDPWFDLTEIERVQKDMHQAQDSIEDDPEALSWDLAWKGLFPGHPWGRPSMGTAASVGRITRGRLRSFHDRVIQGSNLVIGVSGAVDPERLKILVHRRLGRIVSGQRHPLSPPVVRDRFRSMPRRKLTRSGAPASVVIGFPGPGCDHPDAAATTVLAAILGGATGGAGRLFDELRERQGLAYSVGASAEFGLGGGGLFCTMSTDPERLDQATAGIWNEIDQIVCHGVPEEEVNRVKNSLVDGAVLSLQRTSSRADHLAASGLYGPPDGDYRAILERPRLVEARDVKSLAERILMRHRSVESIVAPG